MSIRIVLENPPEFYTNQDVIRGQVLLTLNRHENLGAIVVKLEGESRTALAIPPTDYNSPMSTRERGNPGDTLNENHKILYKVGQVFPDEHAPAAAAPYVLSPGQHRFPFEFKFPFNNACSNIDAMSRIGGVVSASGPFGVGFRVMDGTKQLMYTHVTKTLPPSFTGFPGQAEIRYYIKVTVQRPGIFKENWRYEMGLKFLPIEPPRPPKTNQEAYARRPFTFQPRTPTPTPYERKRSSLFGRSSGPPTPVNGTPNLQPGSPTTNSAPPSVEMSARLPHPAILTCNKPVPLRLIAKKLAPAQAEVYLIALQIDLIGKTTVRSQTLVNTEVSRWVIMARQGLSILVSKPEDPTGTEFVVPDTFWTGFPLPNTVMPSFVTCNLRYAFHPPASKTTDPCSLPSPAAITSSKSSSASPGASLPPGALPTALFSAAEANTKTPPTSTKNSISLSSLLPSRSTRASPLQPPLSKPCAWAVPPAPDHAHHNSSNNNNPHKLQTSRHARSTNPGPKPKHSPQTPSTRPSYNRARARRTTTPRPRTRRPWPRR